MLTGIGDFVSTYVHLPTPAASTVALWIVMTWLHDRLDLSPFLHLTSATRRCGKSALLEVIGTLVRRPLMTSHATVAAISRLIERDGPSLLLDEIDRRFRAADAAVLIGIINSSQRRESAYIYRCTGGNHDLTTFETWCPKAFAGISHLPDTVMDRSIVLRLERQAPGTALRWRDRDRDLVTALQRRILRWVTDNVDAILAARSAVSFPDALHDRARDAWETLLAVGHVAGGDWAGGGRAWAACVYVDADAENEGGPEEQLLVDLRAVFHNRRRPAGAGDTVDPARAARDGLPAVEPLREGQTAFAAGAGQSAQTVPCDSEHRPAVRRRHPEGIQARGVGSTMEGVLSRSGFTPDVRNARYTLENKRIVGTPDPLRLVAP